MADGCDRRAALMRTRHLSGLLFLSALWGAGFLFNRVAVREMEATTLIGLRMAVGTLTLAPFVVRKLGPRPLLAAVRARFWQLAAAGLAGTVVASTSIAWGQNDLDSGTTAIIVASSPLFATLISLVVARHDVMSGRRLVGLVVGFGGVALLIGAQPSGSLLAAGAVIGGAFAFALSTVLLGRWCRGVDPMVTTLTMTTLSALVLLPSVAVAPPGGMDDWKVVGSVLGLGVALTGFGYVLFNWIIAGSGASNAMLISYLQPAFAVLYGVLLLDEELTVPSMAGFAIVLTGVALATGRVGRRPAVARAETAAGS